eukprot:scaffold2510_cov169-Amphora_coffeaeformis.AAC.8
MEDQQEHNDRPQKDPIVTSGESDEGVLDSSDEDDEEDHRRLLPHPERPPPCEGTATTIRTNNNYAEDALYDENADDEDEAYVYNVLRSGSADPAVVANKASPQKKIQKPRNSDAVLSCPCCLSIVCMDCQQHERYENQYRAMFVMNIIVRWDVKLHYDAAEGQLVPVSDEPTSLPQAGGNHHSEKPRVVVEDHPEQEKGGGDDAYYYKVCCANCQTQVASLDMTDEVYHFYGCVASA